MTRPGLWILTLLALASLLGAGLAPAACPAPAALGPCNCVTYSGPHIDGASGQYYYHFESSCDTSRYCKVTVNHHDGTSNPYGGTLPAGGTLDIYVGRLVSSDTEDVDTGG